MIGPSPLSVCVLVLTELSVLSGVFAAAAASVCSSQTAENFAPTPQQANKQRNKTIWRCSNVI